MEDGKYPPIELILLIPYHYVFCTYKYMIYSQIMSLNPRERAGSHPSGHPPPSHRLQFFLASPCLIFDRISKIHIFGTKLGDYIPFCTKIVK